MCPTRSGNYANRSVMIVAVFIGWLGASLAGLCLLKKFDNTPGRPADGPESILGSELVASRGKHRLVLFAHPHCPCSRAAITELEKLVRTSGNRLDVDVYFLRPKIVTKDWETSAQVLQVSAIAGANVHWDDDGKQARSFGAHTSGHVVLIDERGQIAFSGGITSSRGHPGPNLGSDAVSAILRGDVPTAREAPVFGCPLESADDQGDRS